MRMRRKATIIEADGYKAETCSYLSGQDMYILDNSGYIYTTLDGNIYYIGDGSVYMFCLVGNAENPLVGEFEDNGDIDPDSTGLVGVKKYDEDSLLVTLAVINEDYFAALEETCGYSEGSCEGILIKYLVSSDTYTIKIIGDNGTADAQYKNLYTGSKKLKKKVTLYIRK